MSRTRAVPSWCPFNCTIIRCDTSSVPCVNGAAVMCSRYAPAWRIAGSRRRTPGRAAPHVSSLRGGPSIQCERPAGAVAAERQLQHLPRRSPILPLMHRVIDERGDREGTFRHHHLAAVRPAARASGTDGLMARLVTEVPHGGTERHLAGGDLLRCQIVPPTADRRGGIPAGAMAVGDRAGLGAQPGHQIHPKEIRQRPPRDDRIRTRSSYRMTIVSEFALRAIFASCGMVVVSMVIAASGRSFQNAIAEHNRSRGSRTIRISLTWSKNSRAPCTAASSISPFSQKNGAACLPWAAASVA